MVTSIDVVGGGVAASRALLAAAASFNRLQADVELTGLDLVDVEEIVYQPIEASRLAIEAIEIFVEVLLVAAATQHGCEAHDRR